MAIPPGRLVRLSLLFVWLAGLPLQAQDALLPTRIGELAYSVTLGDRDTFGIVTGVAEVASLEVIAVVDAMNGQVTLFSADGVPSSQFGKRGRGPGEFFVPVKIISRGSEFIVLDRGNQRIVTLGVENGRLVLRGEGRVPLRNPTDMCMSSGRTFLLGWEDGALIHEIDGSGKIVNSFGRALDQGVGPDMLASFGQLSCSQTSGRVAYASDAFGVLRVYTPDGESLWDGEIPGFSGQTYQAIGSAGFKPVPSPAGFSHKVVALQWLANDDLYLQLKKSTPSELLHEGRLLDVEDGWLAEPIAWPTVLMLGEDITAFEEVAPYPLVKIYRAR